MLWYLDSSWNVMILRMKHKKSKHFMSWSRWTTRGKLFFAKSGLIGDHFALSCLSHIRNDRTIDCKPWSAKYDSCTELTFMLFSHMCLFFLTTNSNLCKLIFYLWIIYSFYEKLSWEQWTFGLLILLIYVKENWSSC